MSLSVILPALRVALGWIFFYAGITKLFDPEWTAAGFLKSAKTFPALYQWFALPQNIGWVNFLNEWGLTLIGTALILGIFIRFASFWGIVLMLLYYFPQLQFPKAGAHSFIVDEHIIYILVLLVVIFSKDAKRYGLDKWARKLPVVKHII